LATAFKKKKKDFLRHKKNQKKVSGEGKKKFYRWSKTAVSVEARSQRGKKKRGKGGKKKGLGGCVAAEEKKGMRRMETRGGRERGRKQRLQKKTRGSRGRGESDWGGGLHSPTVNHGRRGGVLKVPVNHNIWWE